MSDGGADGNEGEGGGGGGDGGGDGDATAIEPDENHSGELEVTFQLRAKVMVVNESDDPKVGARGGKGFIPLAMLTDEDDREYRCYNWIEDPTDG